MAGPRVWLGHLNGALAIGGQIEKGLTKAGDVGEGIISGGVGIDFYSWKRDHTGGSYKYSVIAAFAGQGGVRYFVSDKFAVQGQIGFGYGTLGLGATWRF